jgi:hypothetical protein
MRHPVLAEFFGISCHGETILGRGREDKRVSEQNGIYLSPDPGNYCRFKLNKDRYYCHGIHGRTQKNEGLK